MLLLIIPATAGDASSTLVQRALHIWNNVIFLITARQNYLPASVTFPV